MSRLGSPDLNPSFNGNPVVSYIITKQIDDANTAGSSWVVAPHKGKIVAAYATNDVANTTTKTVLTLEIGGASVTMPAWEIGATQAVGTVSSSVPTAANTVTEGQSIEIISDGGGTPTMPIHVTLVIDRTGD